MNKVNMPTSKELAVVLKALEKATAWNQAAVETFIEKGYPMSKKDKALFESASKLYKRAIRIVEKINTYLAKE